MKIREICGDKINILYHFNARKNLFNDIFRFFILPRFIQNDSILDKINPLLSVNLFKRKKIIIFVNIKLCAFAIKLQNVIKTSNRTRSHSGNSH